MAPEYINDDKTATTNGVTTPISTKCKERYCTHFHSISGIQYWCDKGIFPPDCATCTQGDWEEYWVETTSTSTPTPTPTNKGDKTMTQELQELLICNCYNAEHQLIFRTVKDDPDRWVYVDFHLCPLPFFKRLWHGIKYIFGYRCKYGDFDEVVLTKEHVESLEKVVEFLKG